MGQQFNLSLWLQDKSRKVVTRDGKPVRIVCWDAPGKNPIYGFVEGKDGITSWTKDGRFSYLIDNVDLCFAEEEEVLTEFEKEVAEAYEWAKTTEREYFVNEFAPKLLGLAREEIGKDVLKDLPELEKTKDVIDPTIPVMYTDAASMKTYVEYDGYKLCINDTFEKLPKGERGE